MIHIHCKYNAPIHSGVLGQVNMECYADMPGRNLSKGA